MRQKKPPNIFLPANPWNFFNNNDANNDHKNDNDKPPEVPLASPDALTSS
jgi:hypothetical protein